VEREFDGGKGEKRMDGGEIEWLAKRAGREVWERVLVLSVAE
jgi:hypothetical protein